MKNKLIDIVFRGLRFIINRFPFLLEILLFKLHVLINYVFRYRSSVIQNNLKNSFANDYSSSEIKQLKYKYYKVLVRYIRESLYIISWPEKKICATVDIVDKQIWQTYFSAQKSTIITASHYGNWEMNMVVFPSLVDQRVVAFYKPISSDLMEEFMLKVRSKYGLELFPIDKTARIMMELKNENILYIFIGDQTPVNMNGVHWNHFLNQETPWLKGAEKLAKKFDLPVVYMKQIPKEINAESNLHYELEFIIITSDPKNEEEGKITDTYSKTLEQEIIQKPEYWLWSHKRWKRAHLKHQ